MVTWFFWNLWGVFTLPVNQLVYVPLGNQNCPGSRDTIHGLVITGPLMRLTPVHGSQGFVNKSLNTLFNIQMKGFRFLTPYANLICISTSYTQSTASLLQKKSKTSIFQPGQCQHLDGSMDRRYLVKAQLGRAGLGRTDPIGWWIVVNSRSSSTK